ncbi:cysteine hydrolase family protein [Rhizobium sp. BK602]|uniref:cysteine hydrolase family protein n=1 Tax=Rhizobium sp. BK602 TaxID=2586986 RepID=UPI001615FF91|nr:cysteine hydrolase family protein [Rhizobium sp. BK602]MBB3612177.1 nicotinamidase-related amidase [Rhizobium sp. BK602]
MSSALLLIDLQNAILAGLGSPERQPAIDAALEGVVSRLAGLKREARAAGIPSFIVQHDGQGTHRLAKRGEGWQLRREIAPEAGDVVVHKASCDSFFETDLETRLRARGITRLVVGGCMTQFCVDTTVRRAVSLGFDVTLIADGHTTADMGRLPFDAIVSHHNMLLDGFDAGAHEIKVIPTAQIAF